MIKFRNCILAALCLFSAGCVQLSGQRVSIFHDQPGDKFYLLIFYDGIHDSGSPQAGEGSKQIVEFVKDGNILFWDWPFHVRMGDIKEFLSDESKPKAQRALAEAAIRSIQTIPLGHYRDLEGRICAAQFVVLSDAADFVRKVNTAISESLLEERKEEETKQEFSLTQERCRLAAKEGRQWLSLEGHSLLLSFPVHSREWAIDKAKGLSTILVGDPNENQQIESGALLRKLQLSMQLLTAAPVSISEVAGEVSIRVGDSKRPATLRFRHSRKYEPNLEQAVIQNLPESLDEKLLRACWKGSSAPDEASDPPVKAMLEWGPPEERARVLLGLAAGKDEKAGKLAVEALQEWAKAWNSGEAVPRAPTDATDAAAYLEAWRAWIGKMIAFPLDE